MYVQALNNQMAMIKARNRAVIYLLCLVLPGCMACSFVLGGIML